jgi:glycosyltransferase involved in cell wall biosynthesis
MSVYGWSTGTGGVHYYRMAEPLRVLRIHGIEANAGVQLDDEIAERHDTILVHCLHDEPNSEAWEKLAKNGQHRMVIDVDDAMWAPDYEPFKRHYTPRVLDRLYRNVEIAHVVTTPNHLIAEWLSKYNGNVHVVPNTVPEYLTKQAMRSQGAARQQPILGYTGSASHDPDITQEWLDAIARFLRYHPTWQWHLWGKKPEELEGWPKDRVKTKPWQDSVRAYHRSLKMEISVNPLKNSLFTASKSGLRAIECAALGIVLVTSNSESMRPWVEDSVTGYLMDPTDDWYQVLHLLAEDHALRRRMQWQARDRAAAWTTEANIHNWVDAWNSVGE